MSPRPWCNQLGEGHGEASIPFHDPSGDLAYGNHRDWPGIKLSFRGPQVTASPTGAAAPAVHPNPRAAAPPA